MMVCSAFIDWIDVHQDYAEPLPLLGKNAYQIFETASGEYSQHAHCFPYQHEGSFSTQLMIRVNGNRLSFSGNISRFNRLDNLFGFTRLDDCFRTINPLLLDLGLPPLTRCTRTWRTQPRGENSTHVTVSDGAVITRLDITTNRSVGQGNELDYLKALASQPYRHMRGHLHPNGQTTDWRSKNDKARLIYSSAYNKAHDIRERLLPKVKRRFGEHSEEYRYLMSVHEFCIEQGIVRMEQKFRREFIRDNNAQFYGLGKLDGLYQEHDVFLNVDKKLQVTAMDIENIAEKLLRLGYVSSVKAANTTAYYAYQWMNGAHFDFDKSQVKTHRARLRKIGIDIAMPCDLSRFSPVLVKEVREIEVRTVSAPDWYRMPQVPTLKLVS